MRTPLTRRRAVRFVGLPLAAAAVVLTLGACSTSSSTGTETSKPGAAVTIGGTTISDDTVATLATEVKTVAPLPTGVSDAALNRQVISALVQEQVIGEAATRNSVTVTDSQVSTLIDAAVKQAGSKAKLEQSLAGQYAVPPTQLQAFAKANLQYQGIAAKLGKGNAQAGSTAASAYISDLSTKMGVSVSPRFGVWDAKQLAVTPPANELSSPAVSSPTGAVPQSTSTP